jgi:hypothetical protein
VFNKAVTILVLILVIALGGFMAFGIWESRGATHALAGAQKAAGTAQVAAGQAQAQGAAAQVIYLADRRSAATAQTHEANHDAILSAPGADVPLDPVLVGRVRVGLCKYRAYAADPGCAGLRQPDPAVVPEPNPGSSTPQ